MRERTLSSPDLKDLSCTLLPGKYTQEQKVPDLYNSVYRYWKETWSEFFRKAGSPPDSLNLENFMRHAFVITVHEKEKVVGTLLSSVFHLGATPTYEHPCIAPFIHDVPQLVTRDGLDQSGACITGEYLSVHPEFRKERYGISMADVLIGILMRIFVERNFKLALAATVRSAKVDQICKKFGYTEVGSYLKCGVDCIMMYNTQQTYTAHPDPVTLKLIDDLWSRRQDDTGIIDSKTEEAFSRVA